MPASWLAVPVGLWCAIDSWILAPRRADRRRALPNPPDPPPVRIAYVVLPYLVVAVIVRMITAETLDFSLVLLLLSLGTGVVWLLDHLFFRKPREAAAAAAKPQPVALPEPGTVDYARSFFPVAFIVLIVRAFIFEPFRIPSDSMMPTLLDGDFIVVNKYAYGLRWPVLNEKFVDIGTPQRGDVVVFRHPPNPRVNYIKRLVGLPGDRVEVHDDHLVINGETIELAEQSATTPTVVMSGMRLSDRNPRRTHPPGHVLPLGRGLIGARLAHLRPELRCRPATARRFARNIGGWVCQRNAARRAAATAATTSSTWYRRANTS